MLQMSLQIINNKIIFLKQVIKPYLFYEKLAYKTFIDNFKRSNLLFLTSFFFKFNFKNPKMVCVNHQMLFNIYLISDRHAKYKRFFK